MSESPPPFPSFDFSSPPSANPLSFPGAWPSVLAPPIPPPRSCFVSFLAFQMGSESECIFFLILYFPISHFVDVLDRPCRSARHKVFRREWDLKLMQLSYCVMHNPHWSSVKRQSWIVIFCVLSISRLISDVLTFLIWLKFFFIFHSCFPNSNR